jgi:hypothetical protein
MNKQFPIGTFSFSEDYSQADLDQWLDDIALLPERIQNEIQDTSDDVLLIPYREDGWTVRQVIAHLLDSHLNKIIRIKTTLTEDNPTIRPYNQDSWADVNFQFEIPLELTLDMLENTHEMMVRIFHSLTDKQWKRTFINPESGTTLTLAHLAAMCAWHSNHHLAHIRLVTQEEK